MPPWAAYTRGRHPSGLRELSRRGVYGRHLTVRQRTPMLAQEGEMS